MFQRSAADRFNQKNGTLNRTSTKLRSDSAYLSKRARNHTVNRTTEKETTGHDWLATSTYATDIPPTSYL
jgi:hypothetical protein